MSLRLRKRRIFAAQAQAAAAATVVPTPKISPAARILAEEHGIDWTQLTASAASGIISKADVQAEIDKLVASADYSQTPPLDLTSTTVAPNPTAKGVKGNGNVLPQ